MIDDTDILIALLREVSRQSEPFQNLIHDYSLDVMGDPEIDRLFAARLDSATAMLRRIDRLKTSCIAAAAAPSGLSPAMNEVLAAASALPVSSHVRMADIVNLVAVELAYRRIDQHLDEPLAGLRRQTATQLTLLDTQTAADQGTDATRLR
jgi:hypothetical protein